MQEAYRPLRSKCSFCSVLGTNLAGGGVPQSSPVRGDGYPVLGYPAAQEWGFPHQDWGTPCKGPGKEPGTGIPPPKKKGPGKEPRTEVPPGNDLGPVTWERTWDWGTPWVWTDRHL